MRRAVLLAGLGLGALAAPGAAEAQNICGNCTTEMGEIFRELARVGQVAKHIGETARAAQGTWRQVEAVTRVRDLGDAMAALNMLGIQNPMPVDTFAVQQLLSGYGGPLDRLDAASRVYIPSGDDWASARLNMGAAQIDGQRQMAAVNYQAAVQRQQQLSRVRARSATANDPKEVWDLNLASTLVVADTLSQQQQQQAARDMAEAGRLQVQQSDEEWERGCLMASARYYRGEASSADCPKPAATFQRVVARSGFGGGSAGAGGGGAAMSVMMAQPWGEQAAANARSLGVNPAALAGTCYQESGCRADARAPSSSAGGAFQFIDSTWRDQAARTGVGTDIANKFDGATASRPAANYLREAGVALQERGVAAPTLEQARGYYQFGPQGTALATADPSATLSSVLPRVSAATLGANGLTPSTTVGEYFARSRGKMGGAAAEPIFLPSNT